MKKGSIELIVLSIVGIFAVGIFTGYELVYGNLSKLEGFKFHSSYAFSTDSDATSSDATSSNATSSDATSSNATSCNATSSDATSSNATSSNATPSNLWFDDGDYSDYDYDDNNINYYENNTDFNSKISDIIEKKETSDVKETVKNENTNDKKQSSDDKSGSNDNETKEDEEVIYLDANKNTVIDGKIFDIIKGTDKKLVVSYDLYEFIFSGNNIEKTESIDLKTSTNPISQDSELSSYTSDGFVMDIASNNIFPGTVLVRAKIDKSASYLPSNLNSVNVYYYNEETKSLENIAKSISLVDDTYLQFKINHTSKYILTSSVLNKETEEKVGFQRDNKVLYLLLIIGLLLIVGVVLLIVILSKKNKKAIN